MNIGDNIKRIRQLKNMSVKELADRIGANVQSIYDWEKNKYEPVKENLESISRVLETPIMEFYNENNTPMPKPSDNNENELSDPEIYRNIIEGKTEYSLIPRQVLDKTQLISIEQVTRTWDELAQKNRELAQRSADIDRRDKQIDFLLGLIRDLTIKTQGSGTGAEPAAQ